MAASVLMGKERGYRPQGRGNEAMISFSVFGIRVALQDVFLSDFPLALPSEKTPLQGETPRPDLSDRQFMKPAVYCRENCASK